MDSLISIVLAAGQGKRMRSELPKVLHPVLGRPMIEYVLEAAGAAGVREHYIVVGYKREEVQAALERDNCHFAVQETPLGTGHAVQVALSSISGSDFEKQALILCGDTPCLRDATLAQFIALFRGLWSQDPGPRIQLLSCSFENPAGYGRVLRGAKGEFLGIREHRDCSESELEIQEINTGIYLGSLRVFDELLREVGNENDQGEYYLTDICELALERGYSVDAVSLGEEAEFLGVNSVEQLREAEEVLESLATSLTKYSNIE